MPYKFSTVFYCTAIAGIVLVVPCCGPQQNSYAPARHTKQRRIIALLPYRGFDTALFGGIKKEIAALYHCGIKILPAQSLPAFAWYAPP